LAGLALVATGDHNHLVALLDLQFRRHFRVLPALKHFGCQRDDLHELLRTELAGHRAEDAGADRLTLLVDQHGRVAVEADRAAVGAPDLLGGPDDHRLVHVALLHLAARNRLLDRDDDHVAHARGTALGTAQHLDALHAARAGIVGNVQVRLHLDHGWVLLLRGRGGIGGICNDRSLGRRHHFPALVLRDRTALADVDHVADLAHIRLVMRLEALRAADELLIDRVHDAALDRDDHGLRVLVAHHGALQDSPWHFSSPLPAPLRRPWP